MNKLITSLGLGLLLAAPAYPQSVLKCPVKELPAHELPLRTLSIKVEKLKGYNTMDLERKFTGKAFLSFVVENRSQERFQRFDPQDLGFVGKDGTQAFPLYLQDSGDWGVPMAMNLAPGAHVALKYILTSRLSFPIRIYAGETLVAEVTD